MKECIFVVINSMYGGGAEHAASRLVTIFEERYKVIVISLMPQTSQDYYFGSNIISISDSYKGSLWVQRIYRASRKIDELVAIYNPKAIISFLQNANLCVTMGKNKVKKIISIRNFLEAQYKGKKQLLWSILMKKYFIKADYIVSVSKLINEEMISVYGMPQEKCICIYNLYDVDEIVKLRCEELENDFRKFYETHRVISSMGRISEQKGHFHLIRVLKLLNEKQSDFGVVIIGNDKDPYAEKVRKLVKDCGLEKDVLFVGHQTNPYRFVSRSFCYVFPSKYEGFPNALVEAMACGVPVISADCKSGPREILTDNSDYGILVDCDPAPFHYADENYTREELEIAEAISMFDSSYETRDKYAKMAFERSKVFSKKNIIGEWYSIIDGVRKINRRN